MAYFKVLETTRLNSSMIFGLVWQRAIHAPSTAKTKPITMVMVADTINFDNLSRNDMDYAIGDILDEVKDIYGEATDELQQNITLMMKAALSMRVRAFRETMPKSCYPII